MVFHQRRTGRIPQTCSKTNSRFKVLSWNIEGLVARLIEPGFLDYLHGFDVCCLLETFTSEEFDFNYKFDNYTVFHAPATKLSRQGRRSGGVVALVKKEMAQHIYSVPCDYNNIVIFRLCQMTESDLIIIAAYIPPADSPYYKGREIKCGIIFLEDVILQVQEKYPTASLLICGDFNARTGSWNLHDQRDEDDDFWNPDGNDCRCFEFTSQRSSLDTVVNTFGKSLIDLCTVHHLLILNGSGHDDREGAFTCISQHGESVVDYCLLLAENFKSSISLKIASQVYSSHMPLEISIGPRPRYRRIQTCNRELSKLIWDREKVNGIKEGLQSVAFQEGLEQARCKIAANPDAALKQFESALLSCAEGMRKKYTLRHSAPSTSARWFDAECARFKHDARNALICFRKSGASTDKDAYILARKTYKDTTRVKRRDYMETIRTQLVDKSGDAKIFWTLVRQASPRRMCPPAIGLDVWEMYFKNLLQLTRCDHVCGVLAIEGDKIVEDEDLDTPITDREVRWAITRLKGGKAPGKDEIPSDLLKVACNQVVPFLTELFSFLYERQYFPSKWRLSVIVPLFKAGDKLDPSNYRGISLLSVVSKLFLSILTDRLHFWAEERNMTGYEQAGFRCKHSTIDHIFTLHAAIVKNVYGGGRGKLYAAFIDYKKAFDSVDRTYLWKVLSHCGVSTKFINMMKAVYAQVQACVRWNSSHTGLFDCPAGVRQGASESPILFSLYISYAASYVRERGQHGIQFLPGCPEIFFLLFADDVVLLSTTPSGLQNQLDNLETISEELGLTVNMTKTKVMVFRRGGHLSRGERWFLGGNRLEVVNNYTYLGHVFSTRLSVPVALDHLAVKGKSKVVQLLKTMWSLQSLNPFVFFKLFDAQVTPALLYGAELWGLCRQGAIEKVHTFACKRFLNVDVKTPSAMVYGETGRYPLSIKGMLRPIKYWLRLGKMQTDRLPKQAYIMLCNSNVKTEMNWAKAVMETLSRWGFYFVWLNGGCTNEKGFLRTFRQRLQDCFKQEWNEKICSSDRFTYYRTLKDGLECESYLNDVNIKKFRDSFIRFRLGINDLGTNGRYKGESSSALCPFCVNQREDEDHFLVHCPKYSVLRTKYIAAYISNEQSDVRNLTSGHGVRKTRDVAMYIYYALKLRSLSVTDESGHSDI